MVAYAEREVLLNRAREGDAGALLSLATLDSGLACGIAHRFLCTKRDSRCRYVDCPSLPDIEDVVQTTFTIVLSKFNRFQGDNPDIFQKWLLGITVNSAKRFLRTKTRMERHTGRRPASLDQPMMGPNGEARRLEVENHSASDPIAQLDAADQIIVRLNRLDALERYVITRIFFDGWTVVQISEDMKLKYAASYNILRRALEKLR